MAWRGYAGLRWLDVAYCRGDEVAACARVRRRRARCRRARARSARRSARWPARRPLRRLVSVERRARERPRPAASSVLRTTDLTNASSGIAMENDAQSEAEQEPGVPRIAGHVAADRDRSAGGGGGGEDLRERAQDRRMHRLVQVGHVLVLAIGGERVLDEIVGADAEEVAFGGDVIGREHGARRLDHRSDRRAARRRRMRSRASSSHTRAQMRRASRTSLTRETSGSRMRSGPTAAAR